MDGVIRGGDTRPEESVKLRPKSATFKENLVGELRPSRATLGYLGLKRRHPASPKPKVRRLSHDEQMEILRRLDGAETGKKLAQDFGVSCTTITVLKRKFGIPVMKKGPKQDIKKLTEDEKAKIACRLAKESCSPVLSEFAFGSRMLWGARNETKSEMADCMDALQRNLTLYDKVRIIERVKNMESEDDIGREFGVSRKTVCDIWLQFEQFLHLAYVRASNAIQHNSSDRDSKRRHTRLTIIQKVEIVLRLKGNEQGKTLAKEYGVGTSTISDIKKAEEKVLYIAEKQGVDLHTLIIPHADLRIPDFNPQYSESENESTTINAHVPCDVDLVEGKVLDSERNENSEPKFMDKMYKESTEQLDSAVALRDACDGIADEKCDEVTVKMEDEEIPSSDPLEEEEFSDTTHGEAYAALSTAIKWAEQQIEVESEQMLTLQALKHIAFRKHLLNLNFGRRNFTDA